MEQQTTDDKEVKAEEKAEETAEKTVASDETTEVAEEVNEVEKLQNELAEEKKKLMYLAADFENTKRRLQKEKENMAKFGSESILSDLIKVVDNLDRTMMALDGKDDPATKNIVVGIQMVHKQFIDTLGNHGLTKIESIGKEFDPNFHEAMGEEEKEGVEAGTIINVFEEAYSLNGRLLRAAKVIVSK